MDGRVGSERFQQFVADTLQYGLALVENSYPLCPVVAVLQDGAVQCNLMADLVNGDDLGSAEAFISELPPRVEMYALIRDGVISTNGEKCCVLIIEAEERGMTHSVCYQQRFTPKRFLRRFKVLSQPYTESDGPRRFR